VSERQFCTTLCGVSEILAVLGCYVALIGIYRRFRTTCISQVQGLGCSYDSNFPSSTPWCGPYRASILLNVLTSIPIVAVNLKIKLRKPEGTN